MSTKIVCVVPSIRPERMETFRRNWHDLFEKHDVSLVTVWDGENPTVQVNDGKLYPPDDFVPDYENNRDLFYRFTDSCRNLGFVMAARMAPDYILTLDDDVRPPSDTPGAYDPIERHLDVLVKKASTGWLNTFVYDCGRRRHFPRGYPYGVRDESPVMLSHGIWSGVLDYDGETQLYLEENQRPTGVGLFYQGVVPRHTLFPLCGMNVMVRREALPYFYFAPMGVDTGLNLHRFGDIWMGVFLKRKFDELGWACYTGGAVVHHARASDARKNFEAEKTGREWNERMWKDPQGYLTDGDDAFFNYFKSYAAKRQKWEKLIRSTT